LKDFLKSVAERELAVEGER